MSVKLLLETMLVIFFMKEAFAQNWPVAMPGCEERCGSLVVPYPFGIVANCSVYHDYEIYCNRSFNPPKPFLWMYILKYDYTTVPLYLEVLNISVEAGTVRINYPITTDCTNTSNVPDAYDCTDCPDAYYSLYPFTLSDTENRFTAMGCDNLALLSSREGSMSDPDIGYGGCVSSCIRFQEKDNSCFGINCCQTQFPPSLSVVKPLISSVSKSSSRCSEGPRYAFIVEQNWFQNLKDIHSVQTMETVPAVLNWKTFGHCQSFTEEYSILPDSTLCGVHALCTNRSLCSCIEGYEGNPYLPDGCRDIDECATYRPGSSLKRNRCEHNCTNTRGSYTCSCKDGWVLDGDFKCVKSPVGDSIKINMKVAVIVIAACAGLGVATTWLLYKVKRRRKIRKLEEKFFKRNGDLLLHQQVSSSEGNVETTKLFTSKELEKATDRYNVDRIVGQGGLGTVYKGMLTDGRIVAVKKSKIEDESKLEHFINEVVILSQINHRNVVKLHGCCLQTKVPLLVYEFIPNGTLMQYIHEQNEYFPLTWDVRLRVATEVAGALYYLHSAASMPIYHRDVKSSNILLDEKYTAKVADFGTSRTISIDQTHLTTRVQGTFGYLDPEYFRTSQFTDKSDVYSFGVVLVELLTGQKPILPARLDDEARSLATLFLLEMDENRVLDIFDSRITKEGGMEEMMAFANIAYRCLNSNARNRPKMKQVVAELESIRNTNGSPFAQQKYEEVEYGKHELN